MFTNFVADFPLVNNFESFLTVSKRVMPTMFETWNKLAHLPDMGGITPTLLSTGIPFLDMLAVGQQLMNFSPIFRGMLLIYRDEFFGKSFCEREAPVNILDQQRFFMEEFAHLYNFYLITRVGPSNATSSSDGGGDSRGGSWRWEWKYHPWLMVHEGATMDAFGEEFYLHFCVQISLRFYYLFFLFLHFVVN
jgi:hypothetical protein